jgi:hypothetical protein
MGKVRLICKYAQRINGVDLSAVNTGDEIELSLRDAEMLIAEGWAVPIAPGAAIADDREPPRSRRSGIRKPSS